MEERYEISQDKVNEILSRANYWNEVNGRDSGGSTNISEVLRSEFSDVVRSLGSFTVLWILEDWARDLDKRRKDSSPKESNKN